MFEIFSSLSFVDVLLQVVPGIICAGIISAIFGAIADAFVTVYEASQPRDHSLYYLSLGFLAASLYANFVLIYLLWGTPFAIGLLVFAICYGLIESIFF